MEIHERLAQLGLSLPPAPAALGAYVQCVRSGHLLFLSGGISINGDEKYIGKVGVDLSIEEAKQAARCAILNRLAVIEQELGDWNSFVRIVSLNGFVNSGPDFYDHPAVINGASDLLVDLLGDAGKHSRTAVGVSALPLNVAVEISLVVEYQPDYIG